LDCVCLSTALRRTATMPRFETAAIPISEFGLNETKASFAGLLCLGPNHFRDGGGCPSRSTFDNPKTRGISRAHSATRAAAGWTAALPSGQNALKMRPRSGKLHTICLTGAGISSLLGRE
jgi:hypothetical protein